MKVSDVMSRAPVHVTADTTLRAASELMDQIDARHLPVIDLGRLVGVLSERDVLELTGFDPRRYVDPADARPRVVRDAMQPHVEAIGPDQDLAEAAELLLRWGIGCLPVVDGERLVGVLSDLDLLAAYVDSFRGRAVPAQVDPPVARVMAAPVVTVETATTVDEAFDACRAGRLRHLPVLHEGWFVGLVSDRDLLLRRGRGEGARRIEDVMTREVVQVPLDARLSEAARLMLRDRIGSVAVTTADRLEGLVTSTDVLARLHALQPA